MPKRNTTKTKRTATICSAQYAYTVIFEPAEEGGFIVKVPALNGIATERASASMETRFRLSTGWTADQPAR